MNRRNRAALVGLALVAAVLAGVALSLGTLRDKGAVSQAPDLTYTWAPATTGTPAVRYEVQIRKGGDEHGEIISRTVPTNQIVLDEVAWLTIYEVRVRGVDANNRVGPWSEWSIPVDRDNEEPSF